MPTYGSKNTTYNLVIWTINSVGSIIIICGPEEMSPLLRKTGSAWHNHNTWCEDVTIYKWRVVIVLPLHSVWTIMPLCDFCQDTYQLCSVSKFVVY
jgi:hypothetical protein